MKFIRNISWLPQIVVMSLIVQDVVLGQLELKGRDYEIDSFEVVDKTAFESLWALNLKMKAIHGTMVPIYVSGNTSPSGREVRLHDMLPQESKITIRLGKTTFWTAFNTIINKKTLALGLRPLQQDHCLSLGAPGQGRRAGTNIW